MNESAIPRYDCNFLNLRTQTILAIAYIFPLKSKNF